MQLRELILKRFGVFKDQRISGLRPGLNLLYGENEAGKTTLLQFVRWVLYGESVMDADKYAPPDGGKHEGLLECESAKGEPFTVHRTARTKRTTHVEVTSPSRPAGEQDVLTGRLGAASSGLFQNLFALTLEELHSLDLVLSGDLKDRIVGAGLGLGSVSLAEVRTSLARRRDNLFKQRGKEPAINALTAEIKKCGKEISDMQKDLVQYDGLNKEIESLTKECAALNHSIAEANQTIQKLTTLRELYGKFVEWMECKQALGRFNEAPDLGESAVQEFSDLRSETKTLEEQYKKEARVVDQLETECNRIEVNTALLGLEVEAEGLRQQIRTVQDVVNDLGTLRGERRDLDATLRQKLSGIGPQWDEARLKRFDGGDEIKSRAREHQSELERAEARVASARNKLDFHREQRAREQAGRRGWPPGSQVFLGLFAAISLAGGGAAWLAGFLWGAVFGALGLIVCGAAAWWIQRQTSGDAGPDPLEQHFLDDLEQAEADLRGLLQSWQHWLGEQGFRTALGPGEVIELAGTLQRLQGVLRERDGLDARLEKMDAELNTAQARVQKLAAVVPDFKMAEDVRVNLQLLLSRYDEEKSRQAKREQKIVSLNEHRQTLKELEQRLDAKRQALNVLFRRTGAKDETGFLEQVDLWKKAEELKRRMEAARQMIQSRVGLGEAFDAFIRECEAADPDAIATRLKQEQERVAELEARKEALNQTLGKRQQAQETLANNDALFEAQSQVEMLKQRLERAARDWAVATLALAMLDKSLKAYQETHQPAVYQAASDWFRIITGGKYESVRYQMEADVVDVRTASGDYKKVEHLSRGAGEQLYLALRLALIQEYEKKSEPLPVLMDDVWVNFDDARRDRFVEVLAGFANDRQVIVLSCHAASRDLCLRHGAHEVLLPAG